MRDRLRMPWQAIKCFLSFTFMVASAMNWIDTTSWLVFFLWYIATFFWFFATVACMTTFLKEFKLP